MVTNTIGINTFYVEGYSSDAFEVSNTISVGNLRMVIQDRIRQKFQQEWFEDQVHPDPVSIVLSSKLHGSIILENGSAILRDLCEPWDTIRAIVPSQKIYSSNTLSQHVALTPACMSSPEHERNRKLLLLVCSLDQDLAQARQAREEHVQAQLARDTELASLKASLDEVIHHQHKVSEDMRIWNRDRADDIRQHKLMQQNLKDNQDHLSHLQEAHAHSERVRIYADQRIKTLEDGRREDGVRIRTLENCLAVEGTRIKLLETSLENSQKRYEGQMEEIREEAELKVKDAEAKWKVLEAKQVVDKRLWEVEKKAWEMERSLMVARIDEVEDMTISTLGWVCGADTKLIDCILLRHLLNLTQAKLAKVAQLTAPLGTNRTTQSILWRDALGATQISAERLQTAKRLLNRADTQLDSATTQFMADSKGMDLAVQKSSAIREMGDLVAHPKTGSVCQEAFTQSISRYNNTEERAGLLAMVKFVVIGTVR